MSAVVGAVWHRAVSHPPFIKPDVPISGIRLSDWFHRKAHGAAESGKLSRRSRPSSP
jgi:hypothetical protein